MEEEQTTKIGPEKIAENTESLDWNEALSISWWSFKLIHQYFPQYTLALYLVNVLNDTRPILSSLVYAKIINAIITITQNGDSSEDQIIQVLLWYTVYTVIFAILAVIDTKIKGSANRAISLKIKREFYNKIGSLNSNLLHSASINRRQTTALENLPNILSTYLQVIKIACSATTGILLGVLLLIYAPIIIPLILILVIPQLFIDRKYRKKLSAVSKMNREVLKNENSIIANFLISEKMIYLKMNNMIDKVKERYFKNYISIDSKDFSIRSRWQSWIKSLQAINSIVVIGGFMWVFTKFLKNKPAIGSVYFELQVINNFQGKMNEIFIVFSALLDSTQKIVDPHFIFSIPSEKVSNTGPISNPVPISVHSLQYTDSKIPDKTLNLEYIVINPKQKVAFLGSSKSGKSILIQIITKQITNYKGDIHINNVPLALIPEKDWFANTAILNKDFVYFYTLSVKENLIFGLENQGISDNDISEALIKAGLDINTLPKKHDQVFNSRMKDGIKPTYDLVLKVILARLFLQKPALVILDQITETLQPAAESDIFSRLITNLPDSTIILLSNRVGTTKNVDNIYVFSKGTIAEQGKHEELIQKGGLYAKAFTAITTTSKPIQPPIINQKENMKVV